MPSTHDVQSGDTLSGIANQYGTDVDSLLAANPQITDPNMILVGQRIQIDGVDTLGQAGLTHVVRQGETLSGIAARYGTTVSTLLQANPQIQQRDLIHPGDAIQVPVTSAADPASGGAIDTTSAYVVQSGDTLTSIAAAHGTTVSALVAANGIANPDMIYPGDTLVIPGRAASTPIDPQPEVTSSPGTPADPSPRGEGPFDYDQIVGVQGNPNVTDAFISEVEAMAQRLDTQPEYLMAVMSFETGGSFSPSVQNPVSGATGLIQFMPATARGLGTSTAALQGMSATEQLSTVESYFNQYQGELGTLEGVYTSVLAGHAEPDAATVLFSRGTAAYSQNSGLDFNHDGTITSGEATSAVASRLYGGVSAVQQQLLDRGYAEGAGFADGDFGPATSAALAQFQRAQGLDATGLLDEATGKALFANRAVSPETTAPSGTSATTASVPEYDPYTVYSTGGGTVRIDDASELRPHHDYQTKVRDGQTLEVRDVTIAHSGQANNTQTVPSPVSGEVLHAGALGSGGNAVILRGEDGGLAYLFHMSRVDVNVGDQVSYGDAIGVQGSTGHSTGDHVHIEAAPETVARWVNDLIDGRFDGVKR